jgi:hypothetical protein
VKLRPKYSALAGLLLLGVCILILAWLSQSKSFQTLQIRDVEYLGAPNAGQDLAASHNTGPVPVKAIKDSPELDSLDISFEFSTQEPTFSYGNLFQTGDSVNAIRMELQPSSNLVLILGDGKIFPLSSSIQLGKYHGVHLKYERNHFFKVFVDGAEALNISNKELLAGKFDISNIVVGTGMAGQRTLLGSVRNFNLDEEYSITSLIPIISRCILALIFTGLLYFFIRKENITVAGGTNYFRDLADQKPMATIAALSAFQLILMLALPAYRNVVITYLFLFVIGINLYLALTPTFLKERFFYLIFIPFNGLIVLSIFGGYFIGFSIAINYLLPTLLSITGLGYLLNYKFNNSKFILLATEIKTDLSISLIFFTLIATPLIICLIYPVLFSGYSTSPYRIGPDLGAYAYVAQYFLDGGTWEKANLRANEFAGLSASEFNRYGDATMSWPLMYYYRWGLSAFQSTVTTITFSKNAYETAFISIALPYLFLCGLVLFWLKSRMGLGIAAALLGVLAFALNANMINFWYEGFYGNAFSLCFFVLILFIFVNLRGGGGFNVRSLIQPILFSAIVFAAALLSYIEGVVFILFPFLAFVFIIDFLMNRSVKWAPYLVMLGGACIGLLIVLPFNFIVHWATFALMQLTQAGGNGYTQPYWALPHEILGFISIYLEAMPDLAGKSLTRSTIMLIVGLAFSCFILYSLLLNFKRKNKEENALYIAGIIFVVISACLVYYKNPDNNYLYMKMYVFFLPVLFIIFWSSLISFYDKHIANVCSKNLFYLFLVIPITINGMVYIFQYKKEATLIENYKVALHDEIKQINFDNVIMYPFSIQSNRLMYPAVLQIPWIIPAYWNSNHWKDKPYYKNFIDHKVYLLIEKEPSHLYDLQYGKVVFQNQCYLIIDSGKTIRDGIKNNGDAIDFDIYIHSIKETMAKGMY